MRTLRNFLDFSAAMLLLNLPTAAATTRVDDSTTAFGDWKIRQLLALCNTAQHPKIITPPQKTARRSHAAVQPS